MVVKRYALYAPNMENFGNCLKDIMEEAMDALFADGKKHKKAYEKYKV